MEIFLLAGLLASGLASVGIYVQHRRRKKRAVAEQTQQQRADKPRTIDEVEPQDVIVFDGRDAIVRGVARLWESGTSWIECRLLDVDDEQWLLVRPDDQRGVVIGRPIEALALADEPPESIDYEGRIYELQRYGEVRCEVTGEARPFVAGEIEYWQYARVGSERLWVRRVGGALHCFAGERQPRHMVDLIQG